MPEAAAGPGGGRRPAVSLVPFRGRRPRTSTRMAATPARGRPRGSSACTSSALARPVRSAVASVRRTLYCLSMFATGLERAPVPWLSPRRIGGRRPAVPAACVPARFCPGCWFCSSAFRDPGQSTVSQSWHELKTGRPTRFFTRRSVTSPWRGVAWRLWPLFPWCARAGFITPTPRESSPLVVALVEPSRAEASAPFTSPVDGLISRHHAIFRARVGRDRHARVEPGARTEGADGPRATA